MNELIIADFSQTDITKLDYDALKARLSARLAEYDSLVYTEDSVSQARKDAAMLNKSRTDLENALKAYKKECLAPYEEVASRIKELTVMIEEQRQKIKSFDDAYREKQAAEKEKEIKAYYDKKSSVLGEYADLLYPKILNKKWLNASTSRNTYQSEMLAAVSQAESDIGELKGMASPFIDTMMEVYAATLSLDEARKKNDELSESFRKAGLAENVAAAKETAVRQTEINNSGTGVSVRIYASDRQLEQICDFMKAIGVTYEI